jgi:arabinofuranosyltransferase
MFAAAFAVPGIAFLAWRWSYYGNALPNTYYAKKSHGTIDAAGVRMVGDFILNMALPYLLLLAAIGVPTAMRAWRARLERPQLIAIGFVVAAALSFLCVGFTFAPVQGYLFRFQMPALPVLLLALVVTAELDGSPAWPMRRAAAVAAIALALVLVLFPLHTLATARRAVELRWQDDRVNMGRALAPLRSYGLTMFATESGALPYYSGWQAFDDLGLNDRFVAMHGLSIAYMRQRDPALVMLRFSTTGTGVTGDFATIVGFLRSGPYRLGAAVYKTDERLRPVPSGIVHLYFVKQSGLHAAALTHALRAARGVRPLEPAIAAATLRRLGLPGR